MTSLVTIQNDLGTAPLPCGMTNLSKNRVQPRSVYKALTGVGSSLMAIWWNQDTRSNREVGDLYRATVVIYLVDAGTGS